MSNSRFLLTKSHKTVIIFKLYLGLEMEIQVFYSGNLDLAILEDLEQLARIENADLTFWRKGRKTCGINDKVRNFEPNFKLIVPQDE